MSSRFSKDKQCVDNYVDSVLIITLIMLLLLLVYICVAFRAGCHFAGSGLNAVLFTMTQKTMCCSTKSHTHTGTQTYTHTHKGHIILYIWNPFFFSIYLLQSFKSAGLLFGLILTPQCMVNIQFIYFIQTSKLTSKFTFRSHSVICQWHSSLYLFQLSFYIICRPFSQFLVWIFPNTLYLQSFYLLKINVWHS